METTQQLAFKISTLANALIKARQAAQVHLNVDDGGTCNFDSAVIKLDRWKDRDIQDVISLSDVHIGDPLSSSYFKGYRFVRIGEGQGFRRTKMAEAAKKSLEADGYDVRMYYQMD